jgi:GH24 family phage-related lysozyme (muramidase)
MGDAKYNTSFKEFYCLEEGFQEDLINKWNELKKSISSSDKFNLDNLKNEIKSKIILLKDNRPQFLKNFLRTLIDDKFTKNIFASPIKNRTIILWILGILAAAGISTLRDTEPTLGMVDYTKIKDAVDSGAFETPKSPEKNQQITAQVVQKIKWGNFENRKGFVNQVKKYESDSGNPLAAYFDRTQTSIGFGTKSKEGETELTPEEAHNRLIDELEEHEGYVQNLLKVIKPEWKLNQNQINALIDISFNVGSGNLSKMLKTSKTLKDLGDKIAKITYATKKDGTKVESQGLIKRRAWENLLLGNPPIVKKDIKSKK